MNQLPDRYKEYLINKILQYPIICSILATCFTLSIPLYHFFGGRWQWIALCLGIFVLLAIFVSINLIPVLVIAANRIILRPTPSCSIYDNPVRYICVTLKDHRPVFYVTTRPNDLDANMDDATKYYIISSWIQSPGDLVTIQPVQFQPENLPGENKTAYRLPEGYGIRPAGPSGGDRQRVEFSSISSTGHEILDSGHIDSSLLRTFNSGWYLVSNCRCELTRWWYNRSDHEGYVNSYYVRLPQDTRAFLREDRESIRAP